MHSHGISYHGQRTRPWIGGAAMPSPPPPSKYLAPFLSWFSRRKTLVHSIQEGQAASVGEEVSDLAPFGSGQFAQASLDLGLCPATIIELPIGPNSSKALRQRSQADSRRSTGSNASIASDQAVRAAPAEPERRASIPCFWSR